MDRFYRNKGSTSFTGQDVTAVIDHWRTEPREFVTGEFWEGEIRYAEKRCYPLAIVSKTVSYSTNGRIFDKRFSNDRQPSFDVLIVVVLVITRVIRRFRRI